MTFGIGRRGKFSLAYPPSNGGPPLNTLERLVRSSQALTPIYAIPKCNQLKMPGIETGLIISEVD